MQQHQYQTARHHIGKVRILTVKEKYCKVRTLHSGHLNRLSLEGSLSALLVKHCLQMSRGTGHALQRRLPSYCTVVI
jgi:hypothetical protein